MKVAPNTVVSIRFTMKNEKGEVIQDIMNQPPLNYLHGSGNFLKELENGVEGLSKGETTNFAISNNSASGSTFNFDVLIDDVREATTEEITLRRVIAKNDCGPDCNC